MISFSEYISEIEDLDEKALNLGNPSATPGYNQVVILAGAAGSGKSTVLDNILNVPNYKVFNPDDIKSALVNYKPKQLDAEFKAQYGKSFADFDFKNPTDVSNLHQFVKDKKLDTKKIETQLKANMFSKYKPNIVFDGTLKNISKLATFSEIAQKYGYDKKDIHLIWVINDFEIAVVQNKSRERTVSDTIVKQTAIGASNTMNELLRNFSSYSKYIDGDIYVVPNMKNKDNRFEFTKNKVMILKEYKPINFKRAGQPIKSFEEVMNTKYDESRTVRDLINSYIPKDAEKF